MGESLAVLKAYRARLKAAGKLLDVRVVDRCMALLRRKARACAPGPSA